MATAILAFAAYCVVQDLLTIEGEWTYVYAYRAAAAAQVPHPEVTSVMGPAVDHAVAVGALAATAIALVGVGLSLWVGSRISRSDGAISR